MMETVAYQIHNGQAVELCPNCHPLMQNDPAKKYRMPKVMFVQRSGNMGETLGVSKEMSDKVDAFVSPMINGKHGIAEIMEAVNNHFDLSPNEWTLFAFSMGRMWGMIEAKKI